MPTLRERSQQAEEPTPENTLGTNAQEDFEATGETVLHLSKGVLRLAEPSYKQLREARLAAARWAADPDNKELVEVDPVVANWEFIQELTLLCSLEWAPKSGTAKNALFPDEYESFTMRDFRKVSNAVEAYVGKG